MTDDSSPILLFPTHYLGNLVLGLPWVLLIMQRHPRTVAVIDSRFSGLLALLVDNQSNLLIYSRDQFSRSQGLLSRLQAYRRFLAQLRRHRDRTLLDLEGERFTGVLSLLSGARHRVGPAGKRASWFYDKVLELDYHRHRFNAFGELCRPFAGSQPPDSVLPFSVTAALAAELEHQLPSLSDHSPHKDAAGQQLVAIHPGASVTYKLWGEDRFAELERNLQSAGCRVVWVGAGALDAEIIAGIRRRNPDSTAVDACNRLTLPQLVALYRRCAFFIGSDSGPMHLAAAAGVPVYALFGPSKESIWAPLGPHSRVLRGTKPCAPSCDAQRCEFQYHCLTSLLPEQVIAALRQDHRLGAS